MSAMAHSHSREDMEDLWLLVEELGVLSERLQKAAKAALSSLDNEKDVKEQP